MPHQLGRGAGRAILLIGLVGCGVPPRQYGDPQGQTVDFQVTLDRSFVASIPTRDEDGPRASYGLGLGSRGSFMHYGLGFHNEPTSYYLEGMDPDSGALVIRKRLRIGDTEFAFPLLPDRRLRLQLVISGGESGSEPIGTLVLSDTPPPIRISLTEAGSRISSAARLQESSAPANTEDSSSTQ
ncbi:MAG: hypothetical protein ACOCXA_07280 [Planctomycetota bacterium]